MPTNMLPQPAAVSSTVHTFNVDNVAQGVLLAAVSLQGIVNRTTPRIFIHHTFGNPATDPRKTKWMMDYYKSQNIVTTETVYTDIYALINHFKSSISGAVVYDPNLTATINVATNAAGVENLLIISPDMIASINNLGITVLRDLRNVWSNPYDAYLWSYNNYWSEQRHDVLACTNYELQHHFHRDYMIQYKLPVFWFPKSDDPDYSLNLENHVKNNILALSEPSCPILGFLPAWSSSGQRGPDEFHGCQMISKYGKFWITNDWAGNYSWHSGVQVSSSTLKQTKTRQKAYREYDPNKKYVAITMIESGDAPCFFQYGFDYFQWNDADRGKVAYNYSIAPSCTYLLPGLMKKLYEEATENDFFFSAVSGDGYCYPLEGYGDNGLLGLTKDQLLHDFFQKSSYEMAKLDFDMFALYSHPWSPWNYTVDDNIVNTYMTPDINGLTSIISDVGRNDGTTPANANRMMTNNSSIHHCLTRWSTTDYYPPYDTTKDAGAAAFLVDEIRNNSSGGNFIQAMAYSWHFGPRRVKMASDTLLAEGYEFVTLNEFEYLWRVSQNLKLPTRDPNKVFGTKITGGTATSSSSYGPGYEASKAIDGNLGTEWVTTTADKNTGWLKVSWGSAQSINKIVLKDRMNLNDQITGGVLSFSDNTTIHVGALHHSGKDFYVEFPTKSVTWVQFNITSTSAPTHAAGLSEFEAYYTALPVYYTDLARGKTATASGIWNNNQDFAASKAIDGNGISYWASNTTGSTWIKIDLQGRSNVNRLKMKWETGGTYTIEVSADDITYTTVATGTSVSGGGITDDTFTSSLARYVRVSAGSYRAIYNLEVYAMPALASDIAQGKTASASGVWSNNPDFAASKAVDGNDATYWAANSDGNPTWLKVDLGSIVNINRVVIKWEHVGTGGYNIQVSSDDQTYFTIKKGTARANNTTTDDLVLPTPTRYLKISADNYRSIYSIKVN